MQWISSGFARSAFWATVWSVLSSNINQPTHIITMANQTQARMRLTHGLHQTVPTIITTAVKGNRERPKSQPIGRRKSCFRLSKVLSPLLVSLTSTRSEFSALIASIIFNFYRLFFLFLPQFKKVAIKNKISLHRILHKLAQSRYFFIYQCYILSNKINIQNLKHYK